MLDMTETDDVREGHLPDLDTTNATIAGRTRLEPLAEVPSLTEQRLKRLLENNAAFGTIPGDVLDGDPIGITHFCRELVISTHDGVADLKATQLIRCAAMEWAQGGIPIDTVLQAVHVGLESGASMVIADSTIGENSNLTSNVALVLDLVAEITSEIAVAYIDHSAPVGAENRTTAEAFAAAMLSGDVDLSTTNEFGIKVAESYFVLAIALPAHSGDRSTQDGGGVERALGAMQTELTHRCGEAAMSILNIGGGTILIPLWACDDSELENVVAGLSTAAKVPLIAAMVRAAKDEIPIAATHAHNMLEMLERLGVESGLHHFDNLALEYQLTRPGPGRAALAALLEPLGAHPDLWETLCCHIGQDLNRQQTARALKVHPTTVDQRLWKIGQLTGLDLSSQAGLWYVRSAFISYAFSSGNVRVPPGTVIRATGHVNGFPEF